MPTLPRFAGMVKNRSLDEIALFEATCKAAGLDPGYVGASINFETGGTWQPTSHGPAAYPNENPPYAVGLIGFAPATARSLGTTTAELLTMSFAQQLDYVIQYYRAVGIGRLKRPADYYAALFWPAAVGTPDEFVIAREGSTVYTANHWLDWDKKGTITTGDLGEVIARQLGGGQKGGKVQHVPPPVLLGSLCVVFGIFAAIVWGRK